MAKMLKLKFKKVLLKNKIKTNLTLLLLQKLITESFFEMTTTEKNFLKILFTTIYFKQSKLFSAAGNTSNYYYRHVLI